MEDDWATLRGRPKRDDPIRSLSEDEPEPVRYQTLLEDEPLKWATLLRDWGELPTFHKGATVEVIERRDGEYCVVDIDGESTWVPESFLRLHRTEEEADMFSGV